MPFPFPPMVPRHLLNALGIIVLSQPTMALAQGLDASPGVVRIGRLYAVPHITFSTVLDENVFNEPDNPRSDRTFSVLPDLTYEFRIRGAYFTGTSGMSYHHFDTYDSERSANYNQDVRFYWPLNRLTLKANYGFASTRQRPGLEFDTRSRQLGTSYGVEVDARIRAKTTFRVGVSAVDTEFKDGLEPGFYEAQLDPLTPAAPISLPLAMNRTGGRASLSFRQELSPLTTLLVTGEGLRDRFEFNSEKDGTGFRVMPGLEFSKFALISGGISVGLRRFLPKSPIVPAYSGVAVRGNLTSVVRGNTRLSGTIDRDLTYSFEKDYPYHVQVAVSLAATQRLGRHWDAAVTASGQELAYQSVVLDLPVAPIDPDAPKLIPPRITRGRSYSVSLGYLWGKGRIAIEARHGERETGRPDRDYTSRQIGGSFTYGF